MKSNVEKLFYVGRSLACQVGTVHVRLFHANELLVAQQRENAELFQTIGRNTVIALWGKEAVRREIYSPYGSSLPGQALAPVGFNGQWRDLLTDGYPLGQGKRFYSPWLMRFLVPDTESPHGRGGLNPYCYCSADPINFYDPSGEARLKIFGFKVGGPLRFSSGLGNALRANDLSTNLKRSVRTSLKHGQSSEFSNKRDSAPVLVVVPAEKHESNTFTYGGERYRFTPKKMVSSSLHTVGVEHKTNPTTPSAPLYSSARGGENGRPNPGSATSSPPSPSPPGWQASIVPAESNRVVRTTNVLSA